MRIITSHNILLDLFLVFSGADIWISNFKIIGLEKPYIWPQLTISLFKVYVVGQFCYHSNGKI